VIDAFRRHLTYANVIATLALFIALGGTSYAVFNVGSREVRDNSLRGRDIRNNTLRSRDIRDQSLLARDIGRDKLGARVIKESALATVPRATEAERLDGASAQELRIRCAGNTVAQAGGCIELSARGPAGFLGAVNICDQVGRGLPTMAQLDAFIRSPHGPAPQPEWTASVYRNPANGSNPFEQLEAVVLGRGAEVSYDRVYLAVQHGFRCVALPSN
jgi:hypothetical protein